MEKVVRKQEWPPRSDNLRGAQLKQALISLENENRILKTLVAQLSKTVIRNVVEQYGRLKS